MPNDINATSSTATPSFSLGLAPNHLGVVCLVDASGEILRRWRLHHSKCTIGSDRQATIWLDDNKIASFHALLVLGPNNAIIKSFGPGLRLNGNPVQESTLRVGDHLELLGYQFLIESLSASSLASRPSAKMPDASAALDCGHLGRPQVTASTESLHLNKLEERFEELLLRLGDIDEKISRTSTEQTDNFSRQCDSLRSETEQLRRAITQDFTSQIRHLTEDLERQNQSQEDRFNSKFSNLNAELSNLRTDVESGLDQLHRQSESRLVSLEQIQQQSDNSLASFFEAQQRVEARIEQLEALHNEAAQRLEEIRQETNERIVQIEQSSASSASQTLTNTTSTSNNSSSAQPEIEALQERLAQLEGVLVDLASAMHERSISETVQNRSRTADGLSSYVEMGDELTGDDPQLDFHLQNESRFPQRSQRTERFNSDVTTPYRGNIDPSLLPHETPSESESSYPYRDYEHQSVHVDSDTVEVERAESSPNLPAWFSGTDSAPQGEIENIGENVVADYSPLLRSATLDAETPSPIAHWSSATSSSDQEADLESTLIDELKHSPLLRSLLREEEIDTREPLADSPMFDQSDWEESDSYLQTERPSSVTALDILRAGYGAEKNEGFDDDQEEKRGYDPQKLSDAIHEEPEQTLSSVGCPLDEDKVPNAEPEEESETVEEAEPSGSAPAPSRLVGASASRGLGTLHSASPVEGSSAGDDDSVEAYMQRLLARMRGDEPEEQKPASSASPPAPKASPAKPSSSKAVRNTYSPLRKTRQDPAAALIASRPKVDEDNGETSAESAEAPPAEQAETGEVAAPRSAPEKASDLAALRELANDSARAAVKTSDTKTKPVSNTIKLIIASLAAAFGVILLLSNGLRVNLTLVAAATSFMLSSIWILDVIQNVAASKKRQQASGVVNNKVQMKIAGKK